MPAHATLAVLGVIWAISGCFDVSYRNCRITCTAEVGCPTGLRCLIEGGATSGLCAPPATQTCSTPQGGDDAGVDGDTDAGAVGPPEMLCHNGSCLSLPAAVRANLVLLLWPSNLPAVGQAVPLWSDQSGQGNHAHALYPTAPPHVIPDGVQLDPTQLGSGFVVANSPSLDFGSGDFAIIVVAGLSSSDARVSFFRKSDGARMNSRQISIDWVLSSATAGRPQGRVNDTLVVTGMDLPQPSVSAYTLRRAADHLELRLNEVVLGSADLPTAGLSTSNADDVFLGVDGLFGSPAASLQAVIAIRGPIGTADLNQLQVFLRTLFAAAAP